MHTTIFSTHHGINNSKSPPCTACSHDDKVSCLQAVTGDPVTCWVGLRVQTTEQDAFHKLATTQRKQRLHMFYTENLTKRSNAIIINNTNLERMPCTHEREKLWTRPVANVCFAQKQMFCHGKRLFLLENKLLPASLLGTHTVGLSTSAHRFTVDVDIDLYWIYMNLLCVRLASCDILLHPVPETAQIWTGWLGVSSSTKPGNEKTGRLNSWGWGQPDNRVQQMSCQQRKKSSRVRIQRSCRCDTSSMVKSVQGEPSIPQKLNTKVIQELVKPSQLLWNVDNFCEMWTSWKREQLHEFDDKFGNTAFSSWLDYTHTYIYMGKL